MTPIPTAGHLTPLVISGARVLDPLEPLARPSKQDIFVASGRITHVGPAGEVPFPAGAHVIDGRRMLAIPGLISAHYHSHDTLLKGAFDSMPLEFWFLHAIPPNYPKRSRAEIRARVLIGALECLKAGITTVQDMVTVYPFDPDHVDAILEAYDDIGIRAVFAMQVGDAPAQHGVPFWKEVMPPELFAQTSSSVKPTGRAAELLAVVEGEFLRHDGKHPLVTWGLGPATPENCTEEFLEGVARLSRDRNLPVFTHVYESKANVITARNHYAADSGSLISHLNRVGLLNERLTIAHGVWLTQSEIEQVARSGANVALNPTCNLKSRSGVAPIAAYARAGAQVALGTDNSSCSDVQNMFQAMKLFTLLSAASAPDTPSPGAHEAFQAATLGGARALGLGGRVGRIAVGMQADITLIALDDPSFVPLNDAVRQLVLTEPGRSVRTVIVEGRIVIEDGRCQTIDEQSLYEEVERLMPALEADLANIRKRNEALLPYVTAAHHRTVAAQVGLDRFVAGDPA